MFFIGLAGSLMPYLLFLGVLFVLTLGISNGNEIEASTSQDKTIAYQQPESADNQILKNSYVFHSEENRHTKQQVSGFTFPDIFEINSGRTGKKLPSCFTFQHYCFQTFHNFFGLSPPVQVSLK